MDDAIDRSNVLGDVGEQVVRCVAGDGCRYVGRTSDRRDPADVVMAGQC